MKNVIHRIQALGDKAAQLKQVVEGAPAVASGIRDAVAVTASQLQQLRADVQSGVSGLRVEDEDRFLAALREISASTGLFEQAGFALSGVDVELGLLRRLVVRLEKVEEVSIARLRSLHASSAGQFTVQALLNALIKAEEMAARVELPDLTYRQLVVDVGPAPTVRVCWRSDTVFEEPELIPARPVSAPPAAVPPVLPVPTSILGKGSFFEPRSAATASTPQTVGTAAAAAEVRPVIPAAVSLTSATPPAAAPVPTAGSTGSGDWRRGVLDRFKKMPDLSKPRH